MHILLTNDDGIDAYGIAAMARALGDHHSVVVVSPEHEQSGSGHSVTLRRPIHTRRRMLAPGIESWSVTGTPTDCVKLGLQLLCPTRPDLVVSGINHGANLGRDIFYSGTVSAAIEAHFMGYRAMAVSQDLPTNQDLDRSAQYVAAAIHAGLGQDAADALLNINFPSWDAVQGTARLTATVLGRRDYINEFERRSDPQGREYYWLAGQVQDTEQGPETDVGAVSRGLVAVTALHLDVSHRQDLPHLAALLRRCQPH